MARLMVDSCVFIELERRRQLPEALAGIYPEDSFALAAITASELLVGAYRADTEARRRAREDFVNRLLQAFNVIPFDLRVVRQHAIIKARLLNAGDVIGAYDTEIAGTALAHGFMVLTTNVRHFARVSGLQTVEFRI